MDVEPQRLLLGPGDIYINDVYVGAVKKQVEFKYASKYAYQRPGNSTVDVKGERTEEVVTLTAEICDFKVVQLRRAFGIAEAVSSGSFRMRKKEVLKMSGTSPINLASGMTACSGSLKVSKLDRSVNYVSGVDYSAPVAATHVGRKSAGAILDQQHVIVEYDFLATKANAVRAGGETLACATFELNFVHRQSNGKLVQITLYKAMSDSDISLAFHERSSGTYTVHAMGFRALADLTKPDGRNLFEIIEEDPTADELGA
jgi:hypothetical protein